MSAVRAAENAQGIKFVCYNLDFLRKQSDEFAWVYEILEQQGILQIDYTRAGVESDWLRIKITTGDIDPDAVEGDLILAIEVVKKRKGFKP